MERTIPIFRALLEADPEHKHVIHGQLGFALKDKTEPDHQGAIEHLAEAISERDANGETGWLFYEFNRALSRIRSEQGTPAEILADLCKSAGIDFIRGILETDEHVVRWLTDQNIEPPRLREHCAGGGSGGEGQGGSGGAATGPKEPAPTETGAGADAATAPKEPAGTETGAGADAAPGSQEPAQTETGGPEGNAAEATAAVERVAKRAARSRRESAEAKEAAVATEEEAAAAVDAVKKITEPKSADKATTDGPTTGTADGDATKNDTSDPDKPLDEADI